MFKNKRLQYGKHFLGISLIEVMIVLAIIVIITSIFTIGVSNTQHKNVQQHMEKISALIHLAQEQAIFNGVDYGISIANNNYAFFQLHELEWLIVSNDPLLRARELPIDLQFDLYLDEIKVALNAQVDRPQIFITSDGEISPFILKIFDGHDVAYQLTVNHNENFVLSADG